VTSRRRGAWPGVLCTGGFSLQRGDTCDSAWLSLCHLESLPPLRLHKSQEDVTHRSPPASLSLLSRGVTPTSSAWRSRPPGHCGRHPCLEGLPSTLHLMPTTPPPPHSPKATPGFPTRAQPGLELLDSRDPLASTSRELKPQRSCTTTPAWTPNVTSAKSVVLPPLVPASPPHAS
jgi:hypothetical protein